MAASLQVVPPRGEDDLAALGAILATSFGFPAADARTWFDQFGSENIRVAHEGGPLLGGLCLIPMGQFFGGVSVPMVGVAGVGVAPEARGRGIATRMMAATLADRRRAGVALSTLYPASLALYRGVGYGEAGAKWELTLRLREVRLPERGPPVGRIDTLRGVDHLYRARAAEVPGHVDRGPYVENRIWKPRRLGETEGYRIGPAEAPEGYLVLARRPSQSAVFEIVLTDFVVRTPRAAERAFALLAAHATMADTVVWTGSPDDPALLCLPERCWTARLTDHWMVRLVDLPAALEARGWPPGVSGEVHLDVQDAALPENGGRWVLRVSDGRASVSRGGSGAFSVDVRGLASLYAGHLGPEALVVAGLASGSARDAAALFAGPAPWMPDFF